MSEFCDHSLYMLMRERERLHSFFLSEWAVPLSPPNPYRRTEIVVVDCLPQVLRRGQKQTPETLPCCQINLPISHHASFLRGPLQLANAKGINQ